MPRTRLRRPDSCGCYARLPSFFFFIFRNPRLRPFLKRRNNAGLWRVTKDFAYTHWPKKKPRSPSSLRDLAVIAPCQKRKSFALATQRRVISFFCVMLLRRRPFVGPPLAWRGLGRVQFTQLSSPCGTRRDFFLPRFSPTPRLFVQVSICSVSHFFFMCFTSFLSVVAAPDSVVSHCYGWERHPGPFWMRE